MPLNFSKVSTSIEESATLAINEKINELTARGESVIGFGMGELDFETPKFVVDAAKEALDNPKNFRYSSSTGLPALREAIAKKTNLSSGLDYDIDNVVVSNGAKQSMANIFTILCDPGDEIIVPSPYWLSYREVITLAHGKTVALDSSIDNDYKVTVAELEAAYNPKKTKALVLVNPQNPTGTVYTKEELKVIGEWVLSKDIYLIADEIYEKFIYDGFEYTSILKVLPALKDRTIILNGVAKTFSMTGWRLGWMVGPKEVIKIAQNIQSQVVSNVFLVSQIAAIEAVNSEFTPQGQDWIENARLELEQRRNIAYDILSSSNNLKVNKPKGAFYFFIDISKSLKPEATSMDFVNALLENKRVVCVPGDGFGKEGHIRISYAVSKDKVSQGLTSLVDFVDAQ
jgi:aspartate/methionine/tyrosine aminotransferase